MKIMKDLLQNEYFMYQMFYIKNINYRYTNVHILIENICLQPKDTRLLPVIMNTMLTGIFD